MLITVDVDSGGTEFGEDAGNDGGAVLRAGYGGHVLRVPVCLAPGPLEGLRHPLPRPLHPIPAVLEVSPAGGGF